MVKSIIAIDYGDSTGIAYRDRNGRIITRTIHDLGGTYPAEGYVSRTALGRNVDLVIGELYQVDPARIAANAGKSIPEIRQAGATELRCRDLGIKYIEQPTSILKPTLAKMQRLGDDTYSTGRKIYTNRHERDALCHLYYWIYQNEGTNNE